MYNNLLRTIPNHRARVNNLAVKGKKTCLPLCALDRNATESLCARVSAREVKKAEQINEQRMFRGLRNICSVGNLMADYESDSSWCMKALCLRNGSPNLQISFDSESSIKKSRIFQKQIGEIFSNSEILKVPDGGLGEVK